MVVRIGWALKVAGRGGYGGITPRLSGDQTRQAVEEHAEDRLLGGARRQVDLDLGFQLDDAGGEFDEAQPQGIKLHDAPGRPVGHRAAHRPQQPISAGMKEEAELVGLGLVAGGAVRGEVIFPCFDMVLGLPACAIEPLIEGLGATTLEVGDDEAGIASLGPHFDPRDDALDPAPALRSIVELRKALAACRDRAPP